MEVTLVHIPHSWPIFIRRWPSYHHQEHKYLDDIQYHARATDEALGHRESLTFLIYQNCSPRAIAATCSSVFVVSGRILSAVEIDRLR